LKVIVISLQLMPDEKGEHLQKTMKIRSAVAY
jgi:hypothetical protein